MSDTGETIPSFPAPSAAPAAMYPPPSEPFDAGPVLPVRPSLNGLAVAALICGLLGLAPAAIVLGHVGFAQAGRSGQRGRGIAVAGFVLGYLVVVLAVAAWFAYTAFVGTLRTGGYLPA